MAQKQTSVLQKPVSFKVAISILFLVVVLVVAIVYLTTSNFDVRSQAASQRKSMNPGSCFGGGQLTDTNRRAFQSTCTTSGGTVQYDQVAAMPQPRPAGVPATSLCVLCDRCVKTVTGTISGATEKSSAFSRKSTRYIDQLCAVPGVPAPNQK